MRSTLVSFGLVTLLSLGTAACSGTNDHSTVASGTVTAALSAVGPDGATYALPSGATLYLHGTGDAGTTLDNYNFDPGMTTESFTVPAGSYTGELYNPSGSASQPWTLVRTQGGVSTSVPATLVDTNAYPVTVTAGGTTSVEFHFAIAGIGDVTFSNGTVSTSVNVASSSGQGSGFTIAGAVVVSSQTLGPNTALNSAVSAPVGTSVGFTMNISRTTPWQAYIGRACANFTIANITVATGASVAIGSQLSEMVGGSGQLCFYSPQNNFGFNILRTGAATTTNIKSALTGTANFNATFSGQLPSSVVAYDGSKLSLTKFATAQTLTSAGTYLTISDAGFNRLTQTNSFTTTPAETLLLLP